MCDVIYLGTCYLSKDKSAICPYVGDSAREYKIIIYILSHYRVLITPLIMSRADYANVSLSKLDTGNFDNFRNK